MAVVDYESDPLALGEALNVPWPVIRVPSDTNRGFAAGVNRAAAATRAPYLLLLNPDTIVEGPIVRVLEDWLAGHPDVGVAGARILNADGTVQPSARRFPDVTTWLGGRTAWLTARFPQNWFSRRNLVAREATLPMDVDWLSGACLMTRRDLFESVGRFDEGFFLYWEDADFCARVAAAGFRRMYVPSASIRHHVGSSAAHQPSLAVRAFHRSAYRLYWKRASVVGRLVAPLVRLGLWLRGEWRVWR